MPALRLKPIVYALCPRSANGLPHHGLRGVSVYIHRGDVAFSAVAVTMPGTRQVMFMFSPSWSVMVVAISEPVMVGAREEMGGRGEVGRGEGHWLVCNSTVPTPMLVAVGDLGWDSNGILPGKNLDKKF